jgi:hypothetical protein
MSRLNTKVDLSAFRIESLKFRSFFCSAVSGGFTTILGAGTLRCTGAGADTGTGRGINAGAAIIAD